MNVSGILPQPLLDIAQAIGFVDSNKDINATWPLQHVEFILTDSGQRIALFDLLDQVLPPQPVAGAPSGAKWHQLLGSQTAGNLFLTIEDSATPTIVGLGGQYAGGAASLLFEIPVLALNGANLSEIAGTAGGPVRLTLDVQLGWTRPTHPISLSSISLALVFALWHRRRSATS